MPRTVRGLMILLLVVIIIPALSVQALMVYRDYQRLRQAQYRNNLEMARAASRLFSNYVEAIARHQKVLAAAIEAIGDDQEAVQNLLIEQTRQLETVKSAALISPEGIAVAATDEALRGINLSDREYFRDAIRPPQGHVVLSDLIQDRADGQPVFTISQAIYRQGRLIGVLAATINPNIMVQQALRLRRVEGGSIVLFDSKGRLVYRDPEEEPVWDMRNPQMWQNPAMEAALSGHEGVTTWTSPLDDVPRIVARVPVPRWQWVAGAGYRYESLNLTILQQLSASVGLNLLTLALLLIVALFVSSRLTHAMAGLRRHVERFDSTQPMAVSPAVRRVHEFDELATAWEDAVRRRQEAQEHLRQSHHRLAGILETISDGFLMVDGKWRVIEFNRQAGLLTGLEEAEVMGRDFWQIWAPARGTAFEENYRRAMETRQAVEFSARYDPQEMWYEVRIYPQEEGLAVFFRDVTERLRAEAALRQSHERIARTEEFALVMPLHVSLDGRWLKVTPTFCRFLGYDEDELLGRSFREVSHPEDFKIDWANVQRLLRGEINSFEMEKRFIRKDGSITWGYMNCSIVMDEKNRPVHLLTYIRDINSEKRAQQALKRYELLAANTRDIILFVRQSDGSIIEANTAAELAYGYSRQELLSLNISDLRISESEEIRSQMTQAGDGGTQFETYHKRKDGRLFPVEVGSRGADVDGEKILLSVVRDISARRRAEESLRESEARLRFVLENSPDHTFVQDSQLRYLWVGRPLDPLKRKDFIGHRDSEIFGEAGAESFEAPKLRVLAEGRRTTVVIPLMLRGRQRYLEARFEPWRDWGGNIIGLAGYVRDITENRRWAESLQRITDELRRSNEDLEQFAYVASHDLQEPLRMVTGFLDLLRTRFGDEMPPKAMEYVAVAHDGASRMQRLIWDLLDYSRVTTRARELQPTSMETVLQGALARLAGALREAEAELTHDELPDVMGDETQLTQVLQNLIGNAAKFRAEDRKVRIHVGAEREGDMVKFYVRDNGIGIDPRHRERIFLIFQRLHTRAQYAGTGIGLAVVKKIVERHGGKVSVESTVGQGSTFYFTLRPVDGGSGR